MDLGSEATGIVTEATANFCEVSADIDGSTHTLMVNQNIFYAFGIHCEGSLTNLLEEGTEINICYTYQTKPVVTIAWIGEKPELDQLKPVMEDVYGQSGRICHVLEDVGYYVHSDELLYRVKVSKEVIYRNGCPNDVGLVVGDDVKFDAIPVELDSNSEYQATCAWIGREPRLVDRFGLDISESLDVLDDLSETLFHGTVAVIPNDVVAFVKVEMREFNKSVMLFRSSFERRGGDIQDIVCVGDSLCLHLNFGCIFQGCRQWFAVKAWKNNADQNFIQDISKMDDGDGPFTKAGVEQPVSLNPSTSCNERLLERPTLSKVDMVLYSDPPLTGVLSEFIASTCTAVAWYEPNQSSVFIERNVFFIDGMPCKNRGEFTLLAQPKNTTVNVEGVRILKKERENQDPKELDERGKYRATCAWIGVKPSLTTLMSESVKLPLAQSLLQNNSIIFYGTVVQLYLPHKAIILIGLMNQIACLHVTSFLSDEGHCSKDCLISDFIQLKNHLSFKLVEDHSCEMPVCAVDVTLLTSDEYREHLSEALCRNPELYKYIDNWSPNYESDFPDQASFQTSELAFRDTALRFDADSQILFCDPPLKGVISSMLDELEPKRQCAFITYSSSLRIPVTISRFYIFGVPCQNFDDLVVLAQSGRTVVNFEGILIEHEGLKGQEGLKSHFATCVWIGEKPSLSTVFGIQRSENLEYLESILSNNVTFYGKVVKFSLPDKALVKVDRSLLDQDACLHISSFLTENYVQSENHFINDFVKLNQCLSFKLVQDSLCEIPLHVVDAKIITQEELNNGRLRERAMNPDLFKNIPMRVSNVKITNPDTFLCSNNETVLFSDPPLCGSFKLTNSKSAVISYEGIEIDLELCSLFRGRWSCYMTKYRRAIKDAETVYFEAVPRDSRILTIRPYCASLAWVNDKKPSLDTVARVAQALGPAKPSNDFPMIVLRHNDRTYVGIIYWIYLPDDALILLYLSDERVVIRLKKAEFERESQHAGKPSYITDYVYLKEIVKFKIKRDDSYCGGFCAYDVVKSTKDDIKAFHDDSKDWTLKLVDEPLLEQTLGAFDVTITSNSRYKHRLVQIVSENPHLFSNIIDTGTRYRKQVKMESRHILADDCDFMYCESKKVLFAIPPLSGRVIWSSTERAVILFEGIKVDVPSCSVPVPFDKKVLCERPEPADYSVTVHFEAIPRIVSREGLNPFYATLAWIGKKKPSLLTITRSVPSESILIWRFTDRTFVGQVIRFSLPNDALIRIEIRGKHAVVCLHKSAFLSALEPEKPYISDYVHFREFVEFQINANRRCRVGLCAAKVVKSTANAYRAFCETSKDWTI